MNDAKEIYLLGVGGMGMASLAKYLSDKGYYVFGWDDYTTEERRQQLSFVNWSKEVPKNCSICIRSSAIDKQHSIYQEAQKRCQCYLRGEFLAGLLGKGKLCVICGSHGKSTTTAYLIHLFEYYHIPVNYLLGAEFQSDYYSIAAYDKEDEWTLLELDESDGTIELFSPNVSVVLNTDWDHPSHYKTSDEYRNAFKRLVGRTKDFVVTNENLCKLDCCKQVASSSKGLAQNEAFAAKTFEMLTQKSVSMEAIKSFPGVKRRQEVLLKTKYLTVISDYAHHPGELKALLERFAPNSSLYLVFEPHRASRLNQYFDDFVQVLTPVKHLYLCPTYEAFEPDSVIHKELEAALPKSLPWEQLRPEDFVGLKKAITLVFAGAGKIERKAKAWVDQLKEKFCDNLKTAKLETEFHGNLRNASLMRIGGKALACCRPRNLEELQRIVSICENIGLDISVMGGGSNLLIPEEEYPGVVIKLKDDYWKQFEKIDACTYKVGAGIVLNQILNLMEQNGIGGFEFLDGIPGTLGGALSMNAGTKGVGILDRVISVDWMNFSGQIHTFKHAELQYGYRSCNTLKNGVILSAVLKGELSSKEAIKAQRHLLKTQRHFSQPKGASLGCFFKNPATNSAGQLIDQAGLKNVHMGDVFVSPVHANFIVNKGSGTYNDVLKLIRIVRNTVQEKTGIVLDPEVRLLGKNWEQIL